MVARLVVLLTHVPQPLSVSGKDVSQAQSAGKLWDVLGKDLLEST